MPPKRWTKKGPKKAKKAKTIPSRDDSDDGEESTSCDSLSEAPSDADETDLSCVTDGESMEGTMKLLGMPGKRYKRKYIADLVTNTTMGKATKYVAEVRTPISQTKVAKHLDKLRPHTEKEKQIVLEELAQPLTVAAIKQKAAAASQPQAPPVTHRRMVTTLVPPPQRLIPEPVPQLKVIVPQLSILEGQRITIQPPEEPRLTIQEAMEQFVRAEKIRLEKLEQLHRVTSGTPMEQFTNKLFPKAGTAPQLEQSPASPSTSTMGPPTQKLPLTCRQPNLEMLGPEKIFQFAGMGYPLEESLEGLNQHDRVTWAVQLLMAGQLLMDHLGETLPVLQTICTQHHMAELFGVPRSTIGSALLSARRKLEEEKPKEAGEDQQAKSTDGKGKKGGKAVPKSSSKK